MAEKMWHSSSTNAPRAASGRFITVDALTRFRAKCRFDPFTGCVLWAGGTTSGQGNTARYGSFWFEGKRWLAHRWAAIFIHDLPVGDMTVGHCCPHGHNTLCVQHVKPETLADNVAERNMRIALQCRQTNEQRQFWLLVERGHEQLPEVTKTEQEIPWYSPPVWLGSVAAADDMECPF